MHTRPRRTGRSHDTVLPTAELMAHAREALQHLDGGQRFVLWDRHNAEIPLDEEVFELLRSILIDLSQNRAVQILPLDMDLTTVQAAEFLQVSRPHVIKLIDEGKLACRMVGTHRRLRLVDLIAFRDAMLVQSAAIREKITKDAEDSGWGY